jgi:dynamin GTPase
MKQAASLLADEDPDETSSSKRPATFLNVVALGNVGAGKSAVLNSLIGHPVLPTGENGATRAPIIIELSRESSLSSKAIILQIDNKSQQVSASKSLSMNICNLAMLCEALSAFMIKKFRSVFS